MRKLVLAILLLGVVGAVVVGVNPTPDVDDHLHNGAVQAGPFKMEVAAANACDIPVYQGHVTHYYSCHGVSHKAVFWVHYDILWYNQDIFGVYHRVWDGGQYVWVYQGRDLELH